MRDYKKVLYRAMGMLTMLALLTVPVGCSAAISGVDENMLGVPQSDPDRLIVTITCNSRMDHFAAAVEERFPDILLVQDCYTGQYRISEHIARIENHDFGDIIMVKAGHIPKTDMSGQLLDLSSQAFPGNFNANILQADEDGHITLIPGPLSFNGNIYNKTLFEENGWTVPEDYEEFVALIQKINQTGIRAFRNSYFDSASQSYQVYQYSVFSALDTLTQVEGQIWHNKLMAKEAVSLEPMETAFLDMRRMIEIGAVQAEDLNIPMSVNLQSMANREVAMGGGEIDHIQAIRGSSEDEFGFMPHFSMTDGQGWLLNLGYFFGANNELRQKGNEQKHKAVMEILDFIASEEGQEILAEDGLGMMPATMGAKIPEDPVFEQIRTQIESGRYIMRPTYDMFASVLEADIGAFIRGETGSKDILDKCSLILEQGLPPVEGVGEAEADFTILQTGCLKADALQAAAGTDIALIGVSETDGYDPAGGIRTKLYKGVVTEDDITRITQIRTDAPLAIMKTSVTGAELLALLEFGATSEREQQDGGPGWFHPFAVSGLKLTYHLGREEGKRVSSVTMEGGGKLRPDTVYTVAYIQGAFSEEKLSGMETGITMTDAFRDYVTAKKRVAPDTKRIRLKE